MSGKGMIKFCLAAILLTLLSASGAFAAESQAKAPVTVAVLPFSMHAPPDLAYLQDGVRDMLTSRLAWEGKVQVVDRNSVSQAMKGSKGDLPPEEAKRIGKSLKADYVLFGSLTALGQSVSIDAKMASITGNAEPVSLYTQTKSMDEVIPQINRFAQNINQKVFSRGGEEGGSTGSDADSASNRNPEFLVAGMLQGKDNISYLNPNFVEITSEATLRRSGIWRSQEFAESVVGMDVGDLDGDGKNEVVLATTTKVMVFRREAQGLKPIATYNGTRTDRFLSVSVVDVNREGKCQIYVTNLKKYNQVGADIPESVNATRGFTEGVASFGLAMAGGKLQPIGNPVPYFLNGVVLPKRGKVLLGQEKAESSVGAFKPGMFEMQIRGGKIATSIPVNVPTQCNVFNFAVADINNDHLDEFIVVDTSAHLRVLNSAGDTIWKGDRLFATTSYQFEGKVNDRRYNDVEHYFMPCSIQITDLNGDGIPEIVVTRNIDNPSRFLPDSMKYFDKCEVVSLSWDNAGMVENWKTREIAGMVTSLRVADLENAGKSQLVLTVVSARDLLKLTNPKSSVLSYELNVSSSKTAANKQ